jgi:hypothetical protein
MVPMQAAIVRSFTTTTTTAGCMNANKQRA